MKERVDGQRVDAGDSMHLSSSSADNSGAVRGSKAPSRHHRVAILVETSSGWGRRLIRGITNFVEKHEAWDIDITPRDVFAEHALPKGWKGDGVIARIRTPEMAKRLRRLGLPVVNVSGIELENCDFPRVTTNFNATARLAADHFVERGYNHFAYAGPLQQSYVARHAEAFREAAAAKRNQTIELFDTSALQANQHGSALARKLGDWVAGIHRSCGLFSWSIADAMLLLRLCADRDIAVPDEIAILAGDDDPLLCNICRPTLSGLVVASEQIGYQAAQRLCNLMTGGLDDGKPQMIDPVEVHTRNSTNALAIKDEELRRAMRYLRENAHRDLSIDEVADFVPMSRRSLERRFRTHFGGSPLAQLQRLRLARVRQLLAMTDLPVSQVALKCGFASPVYMTAVFRQEVGTTPLRYRAKLRAR
jgi:LacI family transcriptional regulator